ncbi:MAG TPA: CDP-glucose 4,6-dehydratase [Stenomitos sp.]
MGNVVNETLTETYRGKRVLVTGDTGFKGSWLSYWLQQMGAEVVGYALPPERPNDHFHLLDLGKLIRHVDGDVRDAKLLSQTFAEFQPEFLFHLAAQPIVRLSYQDPKTTFDTNVGGAVNILEAVRQTPSLRSAIFVTSDKCYRNKEWLWGYRENDELGGHDPYSASKAAAELVFSAYLDSYFRQRTDLGIASVRAGNVIGGGDWAADRIVPDCMRLLGSSQPITLRNPHATRPWQHVLDPLYGYLLLASHLARDPKRFEGSWNFGPSSHSVQTVQELAERIVAHWGDGEIIVTPDAQAPHEANLLRLNCDKAHQFLKWYPRWEFEETVRETVRWYKGVATGTPARQLTEAQIGAYMGEPQ